MKLTELDNFYMQIALNEALIAKQNGDIPCGAVIKNNEIIAKAHNQTELLNDPTAHAEMIAITQATNSINNWRLKRLYNVCYKRTLCYVCRSNCCSKNKKNYLVYDR